MTLLWIVGAVLIVVCAFVAFFIGVSMNVRLPKPRWVRQEEEAKRIISEALKTAEVKKRGVGKAKDDIYRLRTGIRRDSRERQGKFRDRNAEFSKKKNPSTRRWRQREKKGSIKQRCRMLKINCTKRVGN